MANKDQPRGAEPFGKVLRVSKYIAGGTVYPGDLLKQDNTGRLVVVAAGDASIGVAANKAAVGEAVQVWDHPDQRFVIQSDDATEPAALTAVGLNYDVLATAGDSTYNTSRQELDGSTGATTATLALKLLALAPAADNAFGAQADCIVKINNHQLGSHTGTAGV